VRLTYGFRSSTLVIRFNTTTKVRETAPGDTRYMCLGLKLYRTAEVFCDTEGYVYKRINSDGSVVYHNRFNGWHSASTAAINEAVRDF